MQNPSSQPSTIPTASKNDPSFVPDSTPFQKAQSSAQKPTHSKSQARYSLSPTASLYRSGTSRGHFGGSWRLASIRVEETSCCRRRWDWSWRHFRSGGGGWSGRSRRLRGLRLRIRVRLGIIISRRRGGCWGMSRRWGWRRVSRGRLMCVSLFPLVFGCMTILTRSQYVTVVEDRGQKVVVGLHGLATNGV